MSFLTERMVRLATPASRVALRSTRTAAPATPSVAARAAAFSTTSPARKTPTEAVKDGLKKADRAVSDNIVIPGLDAAAKAKEKAENLTHGEVKGKAEELKGQAKGAAHEAAGKAKGAAEEVKGKL